jgi:hypothetical protein
MSRERAEIRIQIRSDRDGFPTEAEQDLRHTLENLVEERGIGEIVDAGSGMGVLDIAVAVSRPKEALRAIRALMAELGIESGSTCRIVRPRRAPAPEVPFRPGDCLAVHLPDGDYGAALVLARRDEPNTGPSLLVGTLRYKAADLPPVDVFERREWLILDHHRWRRVPDLLWCTPFDFPAVSAKLQCIGRLELQPSDPSDAQAFSGWAAVGVQTVAQARWDAGIRD